MSGVPAALIQFEACSDVSLIRGTMPMSTESRDRRPPGRKEKQDDENELFREAVGDVVQLPPSDKITPARKRPKPHPFQTRRDEQEALVDSLSDPAEWDVGNETGDELIFVRPGLSRQILRKLRRGHWVIQDQLDLHGYTSDAARAELAAFLQSCIRRGVRCLRIIHGKGRGSKNREPVLKYKVRHWLMQRDEVLAFCQARPSDGGGGAVVVLLKSN